MQDVLVNTGQVSDLKTEEWGPEKTTEKMPVSYCTPVRVTTPQALFWHSKSNWVTVARFVESWGRAVSSTSTFHCHFWIRSLACTHDQSVSHMHRTQKSKAQTFVQFVSFCSGSFSQGSKGRADITRTQIASYICGEWIQSNSHCIYKPLLSALKF